MHTCSDCIHELLLRVSSVCLTRHGGPCAALAGWQQPPARSKPQRRESVTHARSAPPLHCPPAYRDRHPDGTTQMTAQIGKHFASPKAWATGKAADDLALLKSWFYLGHVRAPLAPTPSSACSGSRVGCRLTCRPCAATNTAEALTDRSVLCPAAHEGGG